MVLDASIGMLSYLRVACATNGFSQVKQQKLRVERSRIVPTLGLS
jgi:hypothetical protein